MMSLRYSVFPWPVCCTVVPSYFPFFKYCLVKFQVEPYHCPLPPHYWTTFKNHLLQFFFNHSCCLCMLFPLYHQSPRSTVNHRQVCTPAIMYYIDNKPCPIVCSCNLTRIMHSWRKVNRLISDAVPDHSLIFLKFYEQVSFSNQIYSSVHFHMLHSSSSFPRKYTGSSSFSLKTKHFLFTLISTSISFLSRVTNNVFICNPNSYINSPSIRPA